MPELQRASLGKMAMAALLAVLVHTLGADAGWLLAALLGLCLVKRVRRALDERDAHVTDARTDAYLQSRSPRADMERRWSRLGSARGRLLAGADRQSELADQIRRLEYGRQAREYQSWLAPQDRAQSHDLQAPTIRKRKRKPKRQRH